MSFDLYFFKRIDAAVTQEDIRQYLTNVIPPAADAVNQWFYENENTGVYFNVDFDQVLAGEEEAGFENTGFSFNLNYMRPDFFGQEAFPFVSRLLTALDLLVLNPQADAESDIPHVPQPESLYKSWATFNLHTSQKHFSAETCYAPIEKTQKTWWYNFNRSQLQAAVGGDYFVPRLFCCRTKATNTFFTLAVWTEYMPAVIPVADYYTLAWQEEGDFDDEWVSKMISRETFMTTFGDFFEPFDFEECKIIHPENAAQVARRFYEVPAEFDFATFGEGVAMELLYNSKPGL